jgi:hypothetical protein
MSPFVEEPGVRMKNLEYRSQKPEARSQKKIVGIALNPRLSTTPGMESATLLFMDEKQRSRAEDMAKLPDRRPWMAKTL